MTQLLDEISEAIIFEPLSLVDSIFKHRFYTFEEPLEDTPHILQILYLFPHGNTVATAPAAVQKNEDLVEEPDEEWNTPYPTRDIKTYEFPDEFTTLMLPRLGSVATWPPCTPPKHAGASSLRYEAGTRAAPPPPTPSTPQRACRAIFPPLPLHRYRYLATTRAGISFLRYELYATRV